MTQIALFKPREIGPKPWGTELLIAETPHYIGKVLSMTAGHRGGMQYHERKDETFYLFSGEAMVSYIVRANGVETVMDMTMQPGDSIHVPPGAVHQVEALTDCVFFEASTPVFEDRVNVGAQYGRPDSGQSR